MKQVTSSEFQKTYAALTEAVEVYRYRNQRLGTYYPDAPGVVRADPEAGEPQPGRCPGHLQRISELEEEVKALKRQLAARSFEDVKSYTGGMNAQDKAFFERKLGKRGR